MEEIYTKVIKSGPYIEQYHYERPIIRVKRNTSKKSYPPGLNNHFRNNQDRKNRTDAIRRSVKKIKRLIAANFPYSYRSLTLTFSDSNNFDITSIDDCYNAFVKFRKRMNHHLKKNDVDKAFKYIGTIEFQELNNRKAVHYHLLTDLPFIKKNSLESIWKSGFVDIKHYTNSPTEHQIVSNYLTKGIYDPRLDNQRKRYLSSQNLIQPVTLLGSEADELIQKIEPLKKLSYSADTYNSEYLGDIYVERYYLEPYQAKKLLNLA